MRYIFLILLISNTCIGQITGMVINEKSLEPIAYTNIWIKDKNTGTSADENGLFNLNGAVKEDYLVFSAIGYLTKTIKVKNIKNTVQLEPEIFILDEVTITKTTHEKELQIGRFRRANILRVNASSSNPVINAVFFPYDNQYQKTPFLKKIHIYTDSQIEGASYNIRLYNIGPDGAPSSYLYHKNILVSCKKGAGVQEIDVSEYNIKIPEAGFFVATERLGVESNSHEVDVRLPHEDKTVTETWYEPAFGVLLIKEDRNSYFYTNGNWIQLEKNKKENLRNKRKYDGTYFTPAIFITLSN